MVMDNNFDNYFTYLSKRSFLGLIYRKYWLYPSLNSYLEGKVLDIGCGIGDFLKYYKNSVGVDINPNIVDFCRQSGHEVYLMHNDFLPFKNSDFDCVILDNVLEHLENPKNILNEIHRVLRENGTLIIGVPGYKGYDSDSDHKIFYNQFLLNETACNSGFKSLAIIMMPLPFKILSKYLKSFAVYGIFKKDGSF